jgi:hypothetical protein
MSAQGWSAATTLGKQQKILLTLKGLVPHRPNAFSVDFAFNFSFPGLSLRFQPWAEISERLRR